jgi:hypothetical protein
VDSIIYLVGLIVIVMFFLSLLGLHKDFSQAMP